MEIYVKNFIELLLAENEKQNLISRRAGVEEVKRHIEDSLQVLEWVSLAGMEIVDIGSGAGFPGLILAMGCPQSRVTLIEADLKKSTFLKQVSKELGLTNVEVTRERAEILGQSGRYRARYDFCTSRAVAAMSVVIEYGLPLVKVEGEVLLWKGRHYQQEIDEAEVALEMLGGRVEDVYLYNLMDEWDRAIVAVKKVRSTPAQYPRRVGAPSKNPL